jgi:hypothetical protein
LAHCRVPQPRHDYRFDPRPMAHTGDCPPALESLETALKASCCALIALECIQTRTGEIETSLAAAQSETTQAIASIREAIGALRGGDPARATVLGLGFVLEDARGRPAAIPPG